MNFTRKVFSLHQGNSLPPFLTCSHLLALDEPDDQDEVACLAVHQTQPIGNGVAVAPFGWVVPGKPFFVPRKAFNEIGAAELDRALFDVVLRGHAHHATRLYYQAFHKKTDQSFQPGQRIGYAGRVFDLAEMVHLTDASLDFWLTSGRFSLAFEKAFAKLLGVKYAMLVNSGSSANLLAISALTSPQLKDRRLAPGDEVLTLAAGFPTTVAPILQNKAVPVFLDIDLETLNVDVNQLEAALSPRTKAVFFAHTLGNPFNLTAVRQFCDQHNLWMIEDNCDALGSRFNHQGEWVYTGTVGDLATSSFYPPHHLTMGEGGAVYTNNSRLKMLVESFRDWGRDCWCASGEDDTCRKRFDWQLGLLPKGYDHKYTYSHFGYNLKATDLQASVGLAQLDKLSVFTQARKDNWTRLRKGMGALEDSLVLPKATPGADPSWFGFLLTVRPQAGFTRQEMVRHLESKSIQTRMLFAGNLIKHPCFDPLRDQPGAFRVVGGLENTDNIMDNAFWVGVYPGMSHDMVDYMVEQMGDFIQQRRG